MSVSVYGDDGETNSDYEPEYAEEIDSCHWITFFYELSDDILNIELYEKIPLEDLLSKMPEYLDVLCDDGCKYRIDAEWQCTSDYEADAEKFTFYPVWDEASFHVRGTESDEQIVPYIHVFVFENDEIEEAYVNKDTTYMLLPLPILSGDKRTDAVNIAKSQIGNKEGYKDRNPYEPELLEGNGQAWCSYFSVWCAVKAGAVDKCPPSGYSKVQGSVRNGLWSRDAGIINQKRHGYVTAQKARMFMTITMQDRAILH